MVCLADKPTSFLRVYPGNRVSNQPLPSLFFKGKLSPIRRPLLFLAAADDSFGTEDMIPFDEIDASPWMSAVVTSRGGHLGFVDGILFPRPPFYSERLVEAYVAALVRLCRRPHGTRLLAQLRMPSTSGQPSEVTQS